MDCSNRYCYYFAGYLMCATILLLHIYFDFPIVIPITIIPPASLRGGTTKPVRTFQPGGQSKTPNNCFIAMTACQLANRAAIRKNPLCRQYFYVRLKLTVNFDPLPCSDSTLTSALWKSAIVLTIGRPSP